MNRLLNTLFCTGVIVLAIGVGQVAASVVSEVQQPEPPRMYLLNDGTKCVIWNGELECDFKQGELIRELKYLKGYIGSLQAELVRRKYLNS